MPQTAAAMRAARVSPRLSKPCVTAPPPHWNCSQAAKNREKPAQPMSTVKKRRLRAILLSLTGSPAPKRHKSGLRRYLSLLGRYALPRSRGRAAWGLPPGFAHRDRELLEFAGADDLDRLGGANLDLAEPRIQVFQALGRRSVERHQGVALHQPGLVGGALRLDRHDQQAAVLVDPALHRLGQRHLLGADPQVRPLDAALGAQAGDHALGYIHSDGPPVAPAEDPAVHPDGAALDVDQGTAAESRVERGVGLDQMLDLAAPPAAPRRRDGADGAEGCLETARLADRQHDLSRLEVVDLGAWQRRRGQAVDLEQCQVGCRVAAYQRRVRALLVHDHLDIVLLLDDVVCGQDESAVPDDAGARAAPAGIDPDHALAGFLDQFSDVVRKIFESRHDVVCSLGLLRNFDRLPP